MRCKKKSASSALSAKSQNRAGSNLWESVKSVGTRKRKEDSERLPPVFKSPEEMPCPEDRLTQSLSRKIPHESHIPIHPL